MAKIEAKDSSPFINVTGKTPTDELDNTQKEALRVLAEYYEESLSGKKRDSDEYIVSLRPTNYTFVNDQKSGYLEKQEHIRNLWWAGRHIGQANVKVGNRDVEISIRPRFGERFLLKIIEEVYNIKRLKSDSATEYSNDWFSSLLNLLRRKQWIEKCAIANRYGLPRTNVKHEHQGVKLRGNIDVRRTITPWMMKRELCTYTYEKEIDDVIGKIVYEAHRILTRNTITVKTVRGAKRQNVASIGFEIPPIVRDTIDTLKNQYKGTVFDITENEYRRINYKSIYQMWKPLVDFSWNVISERQIGLKASNDKNECLFVDMAEIWEAFLRKRLGERLADDGWSVWNSDEAIMRVYSGVQFMSRDIIPDIVLQRLNDGIDEFLVFDAKYKRMKNRDDEVDRSDFFQIHTYIHYFQHCYPNGRVLVGGLLYPLYRNEKTNRKYSSMFGRSGRFDTKFIVDGIVCEGIGESDNDFDVEINTLINNIKNSYR